MGELCTQEASGLKCAGQLIKLYIIQRPIYTVHCFVGLTFVFDFLIDMAIDQRNLYVNVTAEGGAPGQEGGAPGQEA